MSAPLPVQPNQPSKLGLIGVEIENVSGRPAFAALLKANQRALAGLHEQMILTKHLSTMLGQDFRLHIDKRSSTQTLFMVWRKGSKAMVWKDSDAVLALLTAPQRQRAEQLNRRAEELSTLAVIVGHSIRWCEAHLGKRVFGQRGKKKETGASVVD